MYILLFLWRDQYKNSWSKQNQHTWKALQKYSYLLHWICEWINSVNPLYLIIDQIKGDIEESNGNEDLTLVPTDKNKDTVKIYEELWSEIKYVIRSITNNSDIMMKNMAKSNLIHLMIYL